MKLSDIKGEDALEVLADIIDPVSSIIADKEVEMAYKGAPRIVLVKLLLKKHKKEIIEIMATLDRQPVEDYEITLVSLPAKVIELLNDPALIEVFPSLRQTETSSGSAMENTEVEEN